MRHDSSERFALHRARLVVVLWAFTSVRLSERLGEASCNRPYHAPPPTSFQPRLRTCPLFLSFVSIAHLPPFYNSINLNESSHFMVSLYWRNDAF